MKKLYILILFYVVMGVSAFDVSNREGFVILSQSDKSYCLKNQSTKISNESFEERHFFTFLISNYKKLGYTQKESFFCDEYDMLCLKNATIKCGQHLDAYLLYPIYEKEIDDYLEDKINQTTSISQKYTQIYKNFILYFICIYVGVLICVKYVYFHPTFLSLLGIIIFFEYQKITSSPYSNSIDLAFDYAPFLYMSLVLLINFLYKRFTSPLKKFYKK